MRKDIFSNTRRNIMGISIGIVIGTLMIFAIITVVLPLPAPAKRRSGPSVANTASLCILFNFENCDEMVKTAIENTVFEKIMWE